MGVKQAFMLALKSLASNKMRSFLTMLGIIIGVAAVIMLVGLMNGFSGLITDTFNDIGANIISVTIRGRNTARTVTEDQMMEFASENLDVILAASPMVVVPNATLKAGTEDMTTSVTGANEFYGEMRAMEMGSGRFVQYIDVERRQKVCVIGSYQAKEIFVGEDPLGKELRINGEKFQVVGVLKEKNEAQEGSGDDVVIVPFTVAQRLSGNAIISSYMFSAVTAEASSEAGDRIEDFLYSKFTSDDAYNVFNQSEMLDMINEITGTLTNVLVGIAAISLLVGGIGIMNIMLVSVTERTREIGIRKSLGAKRKDILRQFLIEAATTSVVGGIIGIIMGVSLSYPLASAMELTARPSVLSIIISVTVSGGIGIIFGYFPARRASKLNPIDALRYD